MLISKQPCWGKKKRNWCYVLKPAEMPAFIFLDYNLINIIGIQDT